MRWLTDDEYANVMKQAQTDEAQKAVTVTVACADALPHVTVAVVVAVHVVRRRRA